MVRTRSGLKTYSHLSGGRRLPSSYELASSRLHYYPRSGFEVAVPLASFYERYQQGSPLSCPDWEQFADPRGTTYTSYTARQSEREIFIDGLLSSIDEQHLDRQLSADWLAILDRMLPTARFLFHGLHMLAAYVAQMGPASRITIAALFQAADELRRTQRTAYRMRQLQELSPVFGTSSRQTWQDDPLWQPLRETVERLLVTYDWGEALVALNVCLKPQVDELFMRHFALLAAAHGDTLLREFLFCLYEDCLWQRRWTLALLELALSQREENGAVVKGFIQKWQPQVERGMAPFLPLWGAGAADVRRSLADLMKTQKENLGIHPVPPASPSTEEDSG